MLRSPVFKHCLACFAGAEQGSMRSRLSISLPSGQLAFPGSLVSPGLMAMAEAAGVCNGGARSLLGPFISHFF